jgi:hypothetical protein
VARDETLQAKDALAGERRGADDRRGTEHKATAHVLGQGTEEVGAGSGPPTSGTCPFSEHPTPQVRPSPGTAPLQTGFSTRWGEIGRSASEFPVWPAAPTEPRIRTRKSASARFPSDLEDPVKGAVGQVSLANERFGHSNPRVATRGGLKEIVGLVVLAYATRPSLLPTSVIARSEAPR